MLRSIFRFNFRPVATRSNEKMMAFTDYMDDSTTAKTYGRIFIF